VEEQVLHITITNTPSKSLWTAWDVDINGEKSLKCSHHGVLLRIEDAMREMRQIERYL